MTLKNATTAPATDTSFCNHNLFCTKSSIKYYDFIHSSLVPLSSTPGAITVTFTPTRPTETAIPLATVTQSLLSHVSDTPPIPLTFPTFHGPIDLGPLIQVAGGSWSKLKQLVKEIPNPQKMMYLTLHSKSAPSDTIHSHLVTKLGKSWNIYFQHKCLEQFPWLSYSSTSSGGLCRSCILFPEQLQKGGSLGAEPGVLVLYLFKNSIRRLLARMIFLSVISSLQCILMLQYGQISFSKISGILNHV